MSSVFRDIEDFMCKGGQTFSVPNPAQIKLYRELVEEEYTEFCQAVDNEEPLENQIKEAIDILVVTIGWLLSHGISAQLAWDQVQINNLLKVTEETKRDERGKIMKSEASIRRKEILLRRLKEVADAAKD